MFATVSKEKCDRAKSILVSIVGQFDKADDRPNFGLKDMKKKVENKIVIIICVLI